MVWNRIQDLVQIWTGSWSVELELDSDMQSVMILNFYNTLFVIRLGLVNGHDRKWVQFTLTWIWKWIYLIRPSLPCYSVNLAVTSNNFKCSLFFLNISGALEVFNDEVVPVSYSAVETSPEYRKSAALGLFYKVRNLYCVVHLHHETA